MEESSNIIISAFLISLAAFLIYHFIDNENDIIEKIRDLIKCGKSDEEIYLEYRYQKSKTGFFKAIILFITSGIILWNFNKYVCVRDMEDNFYEEVPF